MSNLNTSTSAPGPNQMVMGITGRAAGTMNELIAALLTCKITANELQKEVNANTEEYGLAQGQAQKDYFDAEGKDDIQQGAMGISKAGSGLMMNVIGSAYAGREQVTSEKNMDQAIREQDAIIKDCRTPKEASGNPLTGEQPAGELVGENNIKTANPDTTVDNQTEGNTKKLEAAEKERKSLSDRKQATTDRFQRYGQTMGTVFDSTSNFISADLAEKKGEAKQAEILNSTLDQLNQNVRKGFQSQEDTMASEVAAAITAYGSGLAQAALHRPV